MKLIGKSFSLKQLHLNLSDAEEILLACCLFSIGLMLFRIFYTGNLLFVFLTWNLFLAFIPYTISKWVLRSKNKKVVQFLLVFAWLLFIPNSFYIITDLFHLEMNQDVPLWYDLALLFSFAWCGLLFGILSIRQIEKWFEKFFNKKFDLLFIFPVMALNSLGVYVGRYLRFNSWDIITNPFQLIHDIIYLFIHPIRNRFDWSMIICFTLLLTLMYSAIKKLGKALQ